MSRPQPIPEELYEPGREADLAQAIATQPKEDYNPRMYTKSKWKPPPHMVPKEHDCRLKNFQAALKSKFSRRRGKSNLLPHQRRALSWLRRQHDLMIVQCDKNLGPAAIERTEYIKYAFKDHLSDYTTYKQIHPNLVQQRREGLHQLLDRWIKTFKASLSKRERAFLLGKKKANKEPFAHLYLTMKVHKTPLATRPIVSCSGSLLEGLGIWVDDKLKPVATQMRSYIKSSYFKIMVFLY